MWLLRTSCVCIPSSPRVRKQYCGATCTPYVPRCQKAMARQETQILNSLESMWKTKCRWAPAVNLSRGFVQYPFRVFLSCSPASAVPLHTYAPRFVELNLYQQWPAASAPKSGTSRTECCRRCSAREWCRWTCAPAGSPPLPASPARRGTECCACSSTSGRRKALDRCRPFLRRN